MAGIALASGLVFLGCPEPSRDAVMMVADTSGPQPPGVGERGLREAERLLPAEPYPFQATGPAAAMVMDTVADGRTAAPTGDEPRPMPVEPRRR
jgi:hypothetical protein